MPLTSPGNDDDTGENHQPTLRKNTAEPVEQTLKQNSEGYTTFAYGEPTIVGGASNADGTFAQTDTVHAEIALTNTGRRAGTEVVQAYVGDVVTSYSWADRELKAFRRVTLEPGETATVVFDIPVCDCTIADADANRIVEPGEFELLIGHSSRRDDLKRTTFTVA